MNSRAECKKVAATDLSRKAAIRRVMRRKSVNYATAKKLVDNALTEIKAHLMKETNGR